MSISLAIRQTISMSIRSITTAGISNPLPLDTYNGAVAAYSLRKLLTTYAGAAIRVRRSSDNTEQDIGFVAGLLDTATLLTFCGAGDGFITTWYDQKETQNLLQATALLQPMIVDTGAVVASGSKPALYFDGTTSLRAPSWGTVNQPFSRNFIYTNGADAGHVINSAAGSINTADLNSATDLIMFAGASEMASPLIVGEQAVITSIYNGAASKQAKNGVAGATINPGTQGFQGIQLMAYDGGIGFASGYVSELHIMNEAISDVNRAALETNQLAFYGLP